MRVLQLIFGFFVVTGCCPHSAQTATGGAHPEEDLTLGCLLMKNDEGWELTYSVSQIGRGSVLVHEPITLVWSASAFDDRGEETGYVSGGTPAYTLCRPIKFSLLDPTRLDRNHSLLTGRIPLLDREAATAFSHAASVRIEVKASLLAIDRLGFPPALKSLSWRLENRNRSNGNSLR